MLFAHMTESDVRDLFTQKKEEIEKLHETATKEEKKATADAEPALVLDADKIRQHPVTFDQAGLIALGRGAETGLPQEVVSVWRATMSGNGAQEMMEQSSDMVYEALVSFLNAMGDALDAWDLNPALFLRDYGTRLEASAPPDERLIKTIYRMADKMSALEKAGNPGLLSYEDVVSVLQTPEKSILPPAQQKSLRELLLTFSFGGSVGILKGLHSRVSGKGDTFTTAFSDIAKKLRAEDNPDIHQELIDVLEDLASVASAPEASVAKPEVGAALPEAVVESEKNPTAIAAALETAKAGKAKK